METLHSSDKDITKVWKDKFDMIFCLNYASNIDRRKTAFERFRRIGVLPNDNFSWLFNFRSPYEHVIFDVTKNLKLNDCTNVSEFNCMMGHYRIIKAASEMKCNRILIFEDDNVFLKDDEYIREVISKTPDDYDVVLYSYTIMGDIVERFNSKKNNNRVNDRFCVYGTDSFWGCGFYSLSNKAINEFVYQYEQKAKVSDAYTTNTAYREPLKKCCVDRCLSIQREDGNSMHKGLNDVYFKMGCNLEDYE